MEMYRPTIKSNLWLGLMTLAFLALYCWSDSAIDNVPSKYYNEKMEAAKNMSEALEILTEYRLPKLNQAQESERVNSLVYTMLGEKDSPITTDEGNIEDKITVLNPNFAAATVDLLMEAGVQRNDTIAVLLTGSMPGANVALFSALKAIGAHPVIITSVGSSWWGANAVDFTWLDMEHALEQHGIFDYNSIAASVGGSDDEGGLRLSAQGRSLIIDAINRNGAIFIHEGSLSKNIDARITVFERQLPIRNYKAVVNIGGGIASIGHAKNGSLIPTGISKPLPIRNYPNLGVVHRFTSEGVPVIHIWDVRKIAKEYDLPIAQLPLPIAGQGKVFMEERYNLFVATLALAFMFVILVIVKYFDHKKFKWREEKIDPDTIV